MNHFQLLIKSCIVAASFVTVFKTILFKTMIITQMLTAFGLIAIAFYLLMLLALSRAPRQPNNANTKKQS